MLPPPVVVCIMHVACAASHGIGRPLTSTSSQTVWVSRNILAKVLYGRRLSSLLSMMWMVLYSHCKICTDVTVNVMYVAFQP
jgi:ABC-type microcin C transport system permease subunit YejE